MGSLQHTSWAENESTDLTGKEKTDCWSWSPYLRVIPDKQIFLPARKPKSACINVISLASLGRSSAIGGSQTQFLDSRAENDNALAATSPVMAGINHAPVSLSASDVVQGRKRNVTMAGMDSSPGSIEDVDDNDAREEKKRQPVKRACNECRQQKVRAMRRSIRHRWRPPQRYNGFLLIDHHC